MPSLPPYLQSPSVRQVVFVYPVGHKAVPARLFNPAGEFTGFDPKEAQRAFRPDTVGLLIFEDRGPTSYTYTAYLVRNGKLDMSRIGFDHKLEPGVNLIREALATEAGQAADPALAGKVEDMLSRVDWYASMSDDWSVASGGEAYLKKTIGLLKLLPTSVARDLWKKYAPKSFVFPERRASRIASRDCFEGSAPGWQAKVVAAQSLPFMLWKGAFYPRIHFGEESWAKDQPVGADGCCGDCAAPAGWYHHATCDIEECPVCGGQAMMCYGSNSHVGGGIKGQALGTSDELIAAVPTPMDRTAAKKYRASRAITFKDGVSLTPGEEVEVVYRMGHPMVAELHHGGQIHKGAIVRMYSYLKGYPKPPPISTLEKWSDDGISKTPTGARTEPDGYGPDNSPSWLLVLGMI